MSNVRQLPEKCTLCDSPDIVYADVSMAIKFRDDAKHVYTSDLKVCVECADRLSIGRQCTSVLPHANKQTPAPVVPINEPHSEKIRRQWRDSYTTCNECEQPAVILTSSGPKCSDCM